MSYVNLLTATEPGGNTREGPVPLALDSDREAVEVGLYSALAGPDPRVCRIRNTATLDDLWVSPAVLDELRHGLLAGTLTRGQIVSLANLVRSRRSAIVDPK